MKNTKFIIGLLICSLIMLIIIDLSSCSSPYETIEETVQVQVISTHKRHVTVSSSFKKRYYTDVKYNDKTYTLIGKDTYEYCKDKENTNINAIIRIYKYEGGHTSEKIIKILKD